MPNPLRSPSSLLVRRLLGVIIALELFAACGVVLLHANDTSDPLTTDAAVEAFRAARERRAASAETTADRAAPLPSTDAPPSVPPSAESQTDHAARAPDPASPTASIPQSGGGHPADAAPTATDVRPAEGVYLYDTIGHERLDALGGARHDYPAQTSVSVRYDGCGLRERWQPLKDRYDERSVCTSPVGHAIEWYESSRAFFGQTDTRRLRCDEGAIAFSTEAPAGTEYRHRCTDPDTDARNVVTVLPDEDLTIDGRLVRARRVRSVSDVTGDSRAHSEIDSWVHPDTGLTLRRESRLDGTSAGPSGEVRYHEEYTMHLRSLTPRT